jgi:tRNA-dihydrouridine synthase A
MQVYTNRHLRDLLGRLCPAAVLWTEMEKTADLQTEDARHRRLWHRQTERPVVLQLGGDDPAQLAAAARYAAPYGFSEVNLNCGCPSVEAGGADFGAALMQRPHETARLLEAMAAAGGVPVSVKCRVGTHARPAEDGSLPADAYEPLAEFVHAVSSSGAVKHVAVHARAAVLSADPGARDPLLLPRATPRVPRAP